ncbi:MAG: flagellar basal body P-ring formation chaperone FlgA [Sulfuricellaceae bacterium]
MQTLSTPRKQFVFAVLCTFSVTAFGTAMEDAASLRKMAETFVVRQTAEQPGQVTATVGAIDSRLRLPKCPNAESFLPPGVRLWGNISVGIRCQEPSPWTIYVPVTVTVMAPTVIATKSLQQGQVLTRADVNVQLSDVTQMPAGVIADIDQVLGKTLSGSMAAGQPIRANLLRTPQLIKNGQTVKLIAQGGSFQVSAEGKALGNAALGQVVSVRTTNGKVVSGVVKEDGSVEIPF